MADLKGGSGLANKGSGSEWRFQQLVRPYHTLAQQKETQREAAAQEEEPQFQHLVAASSQKIAEWHFQ